MLLDGYITGESSIQKKLNGRTSKDAMTSRYNGQLVTATLRFFTLRFFCNSQFRSFLLWIVAVHGEGALLHAAQCPCSRIAIKPMLHGFTPISLRGPPTERF